MTSAAPVYRIDQPVGFDLTGAELKAAPYPALARALAAGPVIPVKMPFVGRVWLATSHAAVAAMLKDNELFVQEGRRAGRSGAGGVDPRWLPSSLRLLMNNMLLKDEPDHRRLRKLVDQAFRRRGVQDMRPQIEAAADRILDGFEGIDQVDLATEYSRRLPLEVICELLGLPHSDREIFSQWTASIAGLSGFLGLFNALGAVKRMTAYVRRQIEEVRRSPRPGLISDLVQAEQDGDKLDADELIAMVLLLLVAGFETTTHLVSGAVVDLDANPDQKAWLLADLSGRTERAVEELARHVTAVQATKPRYVARDADFFGQRLKRGQVVMACLSTANADPAVFEAPQKLRLERFPNPHLAFGAGIHFCLGQQLARVEAQSALHCLYARYPDLSVIDPDRLDYIKRMGMRGVNTLPVRLGARTRATGQRLEAVASPGQAG
ncbi:MAG: cytochrome P450 [Alphaproteobacteria bacterium]|nr:cytochrome P450 [Alphaproteobacteria bacterium]